MARPPGCSASRPRNNACLRRTAPKGVFQGEVLVDARDEYSRVAGPAGLLFHGGPGDPLSALVEELQ